MIAEERVVQWLVCGWNEETLERDETWFQGVMTPINYEDMGTIGMLRADIKRQQKELRNGTHADGHLIPWCKDNEVQLTQDGAYIWVDEINDYQQVVIATMYEKEWHDNSLIEGHKERKDYFARILIPKYY